MENSEKMWSTGDGNGKPFQYSCLENPMNSIEMQKYMTLDDVSPKLEGVKYATGEERRAITNSSRKNEVTGQSRNDAQW